MNPKDTNLVISNDDIQFLSDKNLIKRKLLIIDTIIARLTSLNGQLKQQSQTWKIDSKYLKIAGKISKGENHNGYPYLILDYPRNFHHSNIFAFRNLFWWGNLFSSTLHISGTEQMSLVESLISKKNELIDHGFMINKTGSEWDNTIDSFNKIKSVENFEEHVLNQIKNGNSIRFTKILNLKDINEFETFTLKNSEVLFA